MFAVGPSYQNLPNFELLAGILIAYIARSLELRGLSSIADDFGGSVTGAFSDFETSGLKGGFDVEVVTTDREVANACVGVIRLEEFFSCLLELFTSGFKIFSNGLEAIAFTGLELVAAANSFGLCISDLEVVSNDLEEVTSRLEVVSFLSLSVSLEASGFLGATATGLDAVPNGLVDATATGVDKVPDGLVNATATGLDTVPNGLVDATATGLDEVPNGLVDADAIGLVEVSNGLDDTIDTGLDAVPDGLVDATATGLDAVPNGLVDATATGLDTVPNGLFDATATGLDAVPTGVFDATATGLVAVPDGLVDATATGLDAVPTVATSCLGHFINIVWLVFSVFSLEVTIAFISGG